jgi:hypothetical protein
MVASWRRDPNDNVFHFSPEEWYYSFIDQLHPLECNSVHIYSYVFHNERSIKKSEKVGCIGCGAIYPASQVADYHQGYEGQDPSGMCRVCGEVRLVGDYQWCNTYGKSKEWFKAIIDQAHIFWSRGPYHLVDKTARFYGQPYKQ